MKWCQNTIGRSSAGSFSSSPGVPGCRWEGSRHSRLPSQSSKRTHSTGAYCRLLETILAVFKQTTAQGFSLQLMKISLHHSSKVFLNKSSDYPNQGQFLLPAACGMVMGWVGILLLLIFFFFWGHLAFDLTFWIFKFRSCFISLHGKLQNSWLDFRNFSDFQSF